MGYGEGLMKDCLFLLLLLCGFSYSYAGERYNSTERQALVNLKDSLKNNTILRTNWTGPQCRHSKSHWKGITCVNGRVTEMLLDDMGLQGSIERDAFQNLTELKSIRFWKNHLDGPLPSLSALSKLQNIDFSHNRFSGPLPEYFNMAPWRQLKLHDNSLTGPIPLSLLNSTQLEILRVEINNLSGTIPPFNQPTLKEFNASYNNLTGQIPNTPVMQSFNESSFLGNPGLCGKPMNHPCPTPTPPPSPSPSPSPSPISPNHNSKKRRKFWTIIEIVVPSVAGLIIIIVLFFCCYFMMRKKKSSSKAHDKGVDKADLSSSSGVEMGLTNVGKMVFMTPEPPFAGIDDLLQASAELIGRGSFGSTYKVIYQLDQSVVVKRFKDMDGLGRKEFEQQMQIISKLQHSNLVPVIGYYFSKEEKLIVFKFMPNGSLWERLHGIRGPGRVPLDWKSRLKIAQGVARGLAYLHEKCPHQKTAPHGNLKSSNVLLDHDMEPVLSDYALVPLLTPQMASLRMMAYKAPECLEGRRASPMADVWTFGILLLELLTGKMYSTAGSPGADLVALVDSVVRTNWTKEVLDLEISAHKEAEAQIMGMLSIALSCVEENPQKRPKVAQVVEQMEDIRDRLKEQEQEQEEEVGSSRRLSEGESSSRHSIASSTV